MEDYQLLIDLHKNQIRQGPGGEIESKKALNLTMVDKSQPLKIADIGCGTGVLSLLLADILPLATITAVDFLPDFLKVLENQAKQSGLSEKITTLCCAMENLPFAIEEYDIIWSEGAIYNMGFRKGIKDWYPYLKIGGLLVVSEITWITNSRPSEINQYWQQEYSEIDTVSSKMNILEKNGYSPISYFVLPENCWLDNYYQPMENSFEDFLKRNHHSQEAQAIVEAEKKEIALYKKYKNYYSYGVYIAKKI
ncbi:class I SAM-dependent methyltransferase [Cyanobacterium stanieri LEGE 03274]|uniref:Class I SAM-dependent methyltransferase n=1 Tax=Cyanobacterium stanieri LEGE 03274 TaxID=1828756 RepID=A0ABR9V0C9_9CHRO|nr:class I SAM-dependent methyltransferase [Cyanobacterium stanieri]MBE9221335.1 class I SAM-dependent methyltransferase [Cyanobacterium stanieri LEGE 03274]